MKRRYFYFLLPPFWGLGGIFGTLAFGQVSVELVGETYTPPQVSFTVSWGSKAPYDNKIWVLAQVSTGGIGQEERALIADVIVTGNATASKSIVAGERGFWLHTDGISGSATVTAALNFANDGKNFSWCVYAFDYPPKATLQPDDTYQLRGTRPFKVNGEALIPPDANVYSGGLILSFTDATDGPGIWDCMGGRLGSEAACAELEAGRLGTN
jgi:hypothetical protein